MPNQGTPILSKPYHPGATTQNQKYGYLSVQYADAVSKNIYCEWLLNRVLGGPSVPDLVGFMPIKKFAPFPIYRVPCGNHIVVFKTRIPGRTPKNTVITIYEKEPLIVSVKFT